MNQESFGNVLVIGSSGVGKSTLIRAVLGSDVREMSDGVPGVRERLTIYESLAAPFRIIDAHHMSGSFLARQRTIRAVKQWSKHNALDGDATNDINVIWFCVEGKSRKLIRQQLADLSSATDVWRTVPVIVVITKSYAELEREDNIELVRRTFARRRRRASCLKAVIPVVAATYQLSESTFVPPEGIPELIAATNEIMPEGLKAATDDIATFALRRRRAVARSIVAASVAAGMTVGAVPIPISDALILTPIETAEINALATLYGIGKGSAQKKFFNTILEVGTVSTVAKGAISALKAVPGINVAASVLNAVIAGSIVAAIGEGTMRAFERVYLGEKSLDDTEWIKRFMESRLSKDLIAQGTKVLGQVSEGDTEKHSKQAVAKLLTSAFAGKLDQLASKDEHPAARAAAEAEDGA